MAFLQRARLRDRASALHSGESAFPLGRSVEVSCGAGSQPVPTSDLLQEVGHGSAWVRRGGRVAGVGDVCAGCRVETKDRST